MKLINIIPFLLLLLFSCNDSQKDIPVKPDIPAEPEQTTFFPVTDFIKGQIAEIRSRGINPVKIIHSKTKDDSSWIKIENLEDEFSPFLSPLIDSANLKGLFTEKTFLDQTINAFTFTYDPIKALPDSFLLQHWDVYVDPQSNKVRRVYLFKKTTDHKILQLTWQTNDFCKLVTISKDPTGNDYVEKEVTIKWGF